MEPTHIDVGAQFALLQASYSSDLRSSLGLFAQAHLTPSFRLGLRGLLASRTSTSSDESDRGDGFYSSWHVDVRGEWHLRPASFFDPWLGVGVGPYASWAYTPAHRFPGSSEKRCVESSHCLGAEATADLGFDLHIGSHVNLGLLVSARAPFGPNRTPEDRADFYVLLPSLRLSGSF